MTRPTYAIAHGNAAVQAARIIAGMAASRDGRTTVAAQQCGEPDELDKALAKHNPRFVVANARRLLARKHKHRPNWAIVMGLYGLGSTYARWLCERYGIDADATTVTP
jgi:hypothetical protein